MLAYQQSQPLKFGIVFLGALLATCLCFYLMLFLISREMSAEIELEQHADFIPNISTDEPETKPPVRERARKVLPLQPPEDPDGIALNKVKRVDITGEKPTFGSLADDLGPIDINFELEAPHSELTPLYVVQPAYPLSAAMREIEGFVIVEFSVKENGAVVNPTVVNSEPKVVFDEAALNAVSRFRFRPREIGGEQVRVDKVQLKFAFNLDSLYEVPESEKR